mmetsp:Transcript_154240/g.494566  ORF Transcript_154240/g.494566 Transcript_154240/m.494566 type:complete len:266 (+) Transcript_154240:194-991(+)
MMQFVQQPSPCTNFASAARGPLTHASPQEDGVRVFGARAKSDEEIINEMLSKLNALQVRPSTPPGLACAVELSAHWVGSACAVGLQDRAGYSLGPCKDFEDDMSTTDEGSSENTFQAAAFCPVAGQHATTTQDKTTLMVRNVPVMYTQDLLLEEWKNVGTFDFLYLPRTAGGQTNLSYAFINFTTEAEAVAFQSTWHKKRLAEFTARKPLNISVAEVQGLRANLTQLRKKRSRCSDTRQSQPLVLVCGLYLCLPDALQNLSFSLC